MFLKPRTASSTAERAVACASQASIAMEAAASNEPDTEVKRRGLQLMHLYDRAAMELLEGNEPVKLGNMYYVHSTSKSTAAYRVNRSALRPILTIRSPNPSNRVHSLRRIM